MAPGETHCSPMYFPMKFLKREKKGRLEEIYVNIGTEADTEADVCKV